MRRTPKRLTRGQFLTYLQLGLVALVLIVWLLYPSTPASFAGTGVSRPPVARVLVVENSKSPDSIAIAEYYMRKRSIPRSNICLLTCPITEECTLKEYQDQIQTPIKVCISQNSNHIDFIVLTKGIPIRTHEGEGGGYCTDSLLATTDLILRPTDAMNKLPRILNPYYGKEERFSHETYGLYLVTRLDAYTRAECLQLVDRSLAARPIKGPFLLHTGPGHTAPDYGFVNDNMRRADSLLTAKKFHSVLNDEEKFTGGYTDLMGYYSWGSNDLKFDRNAYHSLGFAPGGIAETAVSTSGRTFDDPNAPGQSLIADLIAQGVTGCKGYVSEPFVDSIAHPDILFDRYTSGYTLAESFYMASPWVNWKDIVLGDPLCAPYAIAR